MILNIFIGTWVILFSIFTWLAFSMKSLKVYSTGCITALLYFLAASEGVIFAFHRKIPLIGFLVNPFPGNYQPLVLNWHYHWIYFLIIISLSFIIGLILLAFVKNLHSSILQKQPINAEYIQRIQ